MRTNDADFLERARDMPSAIVAQVPKWHLCGKGLKRMTASPGIEKTGTFLLLAFFVAGAVGHSMAFASRSPQQHTQLWHCFYLICNLISMVAILAKRDIGYWWLMAVFRSCQILRCKFRSMGGLVYA